MGPRSTHAYLTAAQDLNHIRPSPVHHTYLTTSEQSAARMMDRMDPHRTPPSGPEAARPEKVFLDFSTDL